MGSAALLACLIQYPAGDMVPRLWRRKGAGLNIRESHRKISACTSCQQYRTVVSQRRLSAQMLYQHSGASAGTDVRLAQRSTAFRSIEVKSASMGPAGALERDVEVVIPHRCCL